MTQILPRPTSASNQIGEAIGAGLMQGGQRGSEVGFQRGLLQKSMEGLRDIPISTTPGQLAEKIIYATAGIPGAEKYVPALYESLSNDLASRQKASEQIDEATQRQNQGFENNPVGQTPFSHQSLQQLVGEKFFPNIQEAPVVGSPESLKPQRPLVPPLPIGPGEEAKIRKELREKSGITIPHVQDEIIKNLKNYQSDFYNSQKEGFANIQDYQQARLARDQNFFQNAELPLGEAHGTMTPSESSIWKELSRQYEDLPDSERFANTEQLYNTLVGNPVIQFENSQRGLPVGSLFRPEEVKNRMQDARSSVQDHLKRIEDRKDLPDNLKGLIKNQLRDQYFNSMGAKDYGIAQAAYAVSNLSPKASAAVPMAPRPTSPDFDPKYLADPKERDKFTYALANSLSNMSPEDSLILMREKALENNYDDKAFNQALNLAINSGKLKLSDFQANERNKLSIPQRLDLDSIMEGKRSVWDYFKRKQ